MRIKKTTLLDNKQIYHKMNTIRSINHEHGSYELDKVSLSCFDDKHTRKWYNKICIWPLQNLLKYRHLLCRENITIFI